MTEHCYKQPSNIQRGPSPPPQLGHSGSPELLLPTSYQPSLWSLRPAGHSRQLLTSKYCRSEGIWGTFRYNPPVMSQACKIHRGLSAKPAPAQLFQRVGFSPEILPLVSEAHSLIPWLSLSTPTWVRVRDYSRNTSISTHETSILVLPKE
jgi:hypothetical protein